MASVDKNAVVEYELSLQYELLTRLRQFARVMDMDHVQERARAIARNYVSTMWVDPTTAHYPPRITIVLELKEQKIGVRIRPGGPPGEGSAAVHDFAAERDRRLVTCQRCQGAGEVLGWNEDVCTKPCPHCGGSGKVLPRAQYR
jgi:hypothetical protein